VPQTKYSTPRGLEVRGTAELHNVALEVVVV
jgi:hypothetical protein